MGKKVIWSLTALKQLEEARRDVFKTSMSIMSANRLARNIFESTDILVNQPEMYPLDKNKMKNDGSYRCYEIRTYNISYRLTKNIIRIIRIRYSGKEPRQH